MTLKEAREAKGMSQEDLAQACGVVRQTISNIEVGMKGQITFSSLP